MAALSGSASCVVPGGGEFWINIATDNVEVAQDVLKTVRVVGKTVVTLGALYFGYKLLKPVIESAVKRGLGGERDDQEFRGIRPGSLRVQLHCSTDERFLEVLADYESGRMKERLQKAFLQVGIKVEGLKVEIENMVEVNETKKTINNRYYVNKDLCEDLKNVVTTSAKSDEDKHVQCSRSEKKLPVYKSIMKPLPHDERALLQEALGLMGPNPDLRKPRAKLIDAVGASRRIRRSINHVSILLFGRSGVGKSSTINHLLGINDEIAIGNDFLSETRSTQEVVVYGSEPRYEVEELPLGVVDTPGFGDIGGPYQDACNFFSVHKFFRTHPKLKGCYPNLIFLFVKANDNRLRGKISEFVKSLRCIKLLNLVDLINPNVVAVITYACGVPYANVDKWSKKMETIKSTVKTIIFEALKVIAPVVLLENQYGPDCYDLHVCGDFTRLPNGVLQPKNLYKACVDVLKINEDHLGLITLNSIFALSTKVPPPNQGHKIEAKNAKSDKLDDEEIKIVEILEKRSRGGTSVGQGYDILTDRSAATQVFMFDATETQYDIVIPKCAKFERVQQTRSYMDQFENYESYTESRLKDLNVSIAVNPNVLMMDRRAGYNRDDYSTWSEVSFLFEQRMFEIKVGNCEEYLDKGVTFTKYFRSDVGRLPCTYDKNDPSCRSSFERFFNRFGHFLVSSAYGGGSIEVKCSREMVESATASLAEIKVVLTAIFEGLDVDKTEFTAGTSLFENLDTLLKRCRIFWEGGDTMLHEKETIADKEKMQKWKESLLLQPTMLTSEMALEPISTAVGCLDSKKDQAAYDALKDLLGGVFEARAKKMESIMKPLPRDDRAFYQEAYCLGLIGPHPDLQEPRAKLMDFINSSRKIKRSMNHVSILLVGRSGVGKSSTINHLLGDEIAKTSEFQSETRFTQEFIVCGSAPRFAVEELPLGVVDTPGFGDTAGSNQDACNFFSIQEFFRTHPKLKGHYPNLIFLLVKANDNRFMGENSEFAKSCRCIKELKIVDLLNPNVVAIMTHACGVAYRNVDKWSEKMETLKSSVKTIIFEALKVTAPVVLLENKYGEDDYDLEVCDDYTRLPNGVMQPRNLYNACADVLKGNNDNLGLIILNSIFAPSTKVPPPKHGHKIEAKNAKSCKLDDEERKFVDALERESRGELRDHIIDTVSQYINEKRIEPYVQEEMTKIAVILRKLADEGDPPHFGLHSLGSIEYHLEKEISSTGRKMLQEKFAMEPRETALDTDRLVGQGYNIVTDKSTATQVFKFDVTKTQYGIVIPKCAKFEKVQTTRSFMDQFENDESYTVSRLKNLNISIDVKPNVSMTGRRAGYNKNDYSTLSEFSSFLYEQRMFEIKVGNYKEYLDKGMTFTKDFRSDVGRLPCTYDKNDPSCRSHFERFFNRFGHFLVSSAYGGGSVEVKCSGEMVGSATASLEEAKAVLTATFEGLDVSNTEFNAAASFIDVVNANALLNRCDISWEGGDTILHEKETIADKEKMRKWKASLLVQPTMLTSEMTLEPISTAVACLDPKKDQATYDALKDLLGGEYKKEKKEKPIRAADERIKKIDKATKRKETVQDPNEDDRECFPSSSAVNVRSKDGVVKQKKMVNLEMGDKVMGWDEKRNRAIFTEIIMFAHRASDATDVEYLKIALEDGNKITLSGNHLVMVGKHKKAILAQKVKRGEILFTVDENREISPKKVLAVDKVIEQGVYCPITVHGNLIVDNVLASCYASVQDHVFLEGLVKISAQSIAHFGLVPMRALHKLRLKWWRKIPNGQTIHPYLQWLCKLKLPFMAN